MNETETESQETISDPGTRLFMVVTLRNGIQIRSEVGEFTVGRSPVLGELKSLHWKGGPDHGDYLQWLDVAEVVAVHAERRPFLLPPGERE